VDYFSPSLEKLELGLKQKLELIEKEKNEQERIKTTTHSIGKNSDNDEQKEIGDTNDDKVQEEINENLIPEAEWKCISKDLPLEFHIELMKHC